MKIAYLIQAHKNFKQLQALISCLVQDKKHQCFIHIDKKSEVLYTKFIQMYSNHSNVHIIETRVTVNWSGLSQVKATLSLMKRVQESNINFNRIHLMSGEDFPYKSPKDIILFLQENRDKEFIEFKDIDKYHWRIMYYNFFTENPKNRNILIRLIQRFSRDIQRLFPKRKKLQGLHLYKGSQWFNISIEAMKYILQFIDATPNFLKQFSYTSCADEHFFQIILLNSTFKSKVINHNLYYTEWSSDNASPNYLSLKNIGEIKKDKSILFIRKISENTTLTLLQDYEKTS